MDERGPTWIDVLATAAEERQGRGQKLQLAQVPAVLRSEGINVRDILQGRRLLEALIAEADGRICLVKAKVEGQWLIEKSSGIYLSGSRNEVGHQTVSQASNTLPRYHRAFWTAFLKRLDAENKRFVHRDGHSFQDVPVNGYAPPDSIEVTREELAQTNPPSEEIEPKAVHAAITGWLAKRGLAADGFLIRSHLPAERGEGAKHWLTSLASLPEADLKRISIPLDVILKALGKR